MTGADVAVSDWVVEHRQAWLDPLVVAVTQLGGAGLLLPLVLAVGLALGVRRHAWTPLALLASSLLGAIGLYTAGKALVGRQRPLLDPLVDAPGLSFPSGHATQAAAVWLALAAVAAARWTPHRRLLLAAAAAVAVLVAASRVYLGVHWASDVVAGLAVGALWTALLARLLGPALRRELGPRR